MKKDYSENGTNIYWFHFIFWTLESNSELTWQLAPRLAREKVISSKPSSSFESKLWRLKTTTFSSNLKILTISNSIVTVMWLTCLVTESIRRTYISCSCLTPEIKSPMSSSQIYSAIISITWFIQEVDTHLQL